MTKEDAVQESRPYDKELKEWGSKYWPYITGVFRDFGIGSYREYRDKFFMFEIIKLQKRIEHLNECLNEILRADIKESRERLIEKLASLNIPSGWRDDNKNNRDIKQ